MWYARCHNVKIEEKNPLKQGLKLEMLATNMVQYKIEEKNPLKQGLKQSVHAELDGTIWD